MPTHGIFICMLIRYISDNLKETTLCPEFISQPFDKRHLQRWCQHSENHWWVRPKCLWDWLDCNRWLCCSHDSKPWHPLAVGTNTGLSYAQGERNQCWNSPVGVQWTYVPCFCVSTLGCMLPNLFWERLAYLSFNPHFYEQLVNER